MTGLPVIFVLLTWGTVGQGHPSTWYVETTYATEGECQQRIAKMLEEEREANAGLQDRGVPPKGPNPLIEHKCVRYRPD
jgi:hypothetical protein